MLLTLVPDGRCHPTISTYRFPAPLLPGSGEQDVNFRPTTLSRWVESFEERAYGDEILASVGFRSSTATYHHL
ncbi:MAG: hypothetical protein AAGD09_25265 [Cyanobacteria bacterium P01_F01_bin.56]